MYKLTLLLLLTGLLLINTSAQTDAIPAAAAVTDRQLSLYNVNGGTQAVMRAAVLPFDHITWSPDGNHLAFINFAGDYSGRLMLTNNTAADPVELTGDIYVLPPTFTTDSQRIIYAMQPQGDAVPVVMQALTPGAPTEPLGQINFTGGCGGTSPFVMDAVYGIETGFSGNALAFVMTPYGLLHSTTCAGVGLALLDTDTGTITDLGSLSRVTVAPDRRRVAALNGGEIVVLDLETGDRRAYAPALSPDQLAWGANGETLYYSIRTLLDEPLPLSEAEHAALSGWINDASVPQYTTSINQLNLNSGAQSTTANAPGWAVGRMFVRGGSLYFSLIPNGEAWVEAITSGAVDLNAPGGFFQERSTVAVTLMRVPTGGGEPVALADDIGQIVPQPR